MRTRRRGFTLVELLTVIVIIGLLMSILLPALSGVRRSAAVARAKAEVMGFSMALDAFKAKYGEYPPSTMVLCENPVDWAAYPRERSIIKTIWPQFDFTKTRDIDRDGNMSEVLQLDGAECLIFFLGGTFDYPDVPNGFSYNAAEPFERNTQSSRVGPFLELDPGRLIDRDGDGMREYRCVLSPRSGDPIWYQLPREPNAYVKMNGVTPWKHQTFQLVSPGFDGLIGSRGTWEPDDDRWMTPGREDEFDNVTNFSEGELRR